MKNKRPTVNVLFVCLGNICRSPMAEGMFLHHIQKAGLAKEFIVDSAGTSGHHDGEQADYRMINTAAGHGITLHSRSRKLRGEDYLKFDHIVAMDFSNFRYIQTMALQVRGAKAKFHMMRDFEEGGKGLGVPDPYYGGPDGFEEVYSILDRATAGFLAYLREGQAG